MELFIRHFANLPRCGRDRRAVGRLLFGVRIILGLNVFIFGHHPKANAETTNKRLLLPGAKAQALGGAFTAVADDASAGWYNPAGLGLISGPGVSVTANNFSRSKKIINGVSSQSSLQENSSSLYPGFAGGHTTLGPFALGWSYFTLEQQNTDESSQIDIVNATSSSPFAYNRSELTTGNLIHAGASLALPLGKNMSFGVSEYYYRRQRQTALKERSVFASGVFYDSFVRQSTQNEGTTTVAGLMVKLPSYSLGLSARIPRALSDKTTYETATVTYTSGTPELSSTENMTHREDETIVRTWNLGLAWTPKTFWLIAADAVYYQPSQTPWSGAGGYDTRAVLDWSVGSELTMGPVVLAGGAFTNSSLVDKPRPSLSYAEPTHMNLRGFSGGVGYRTKQSETLLIIVKQLGTGVTQMVQGSLELQDIYIESQSFSISSRYQF
jgi:hypothetical protein